MALPDDRRRQRRKASVSSVSLVARTALVVVWPVVIVCVRTIWFVMRPILIALRRIPIRRISVRIPVVVRRIPVARRFVPWLVGLCWFRLLLRRGCA